MRAYAKVLGSARPNFLVLAPVCVLVGVAAAVYQGAGVDPTELALVFLGALLAHASVNLLNEFEDFRSGLDATTDRTPFSGGSGTLQRHPQLAGLARRLGVVTLVATALIGLYFLATAGLGLLPVGLLGVLLVASYSRWIVRTPLLCLLAPGVGFGPVMVLGAEYALAGSYSLVAFLASLVPLFLVSGLLLLNQFPDREPDERAGRRHLVIVLERQRAALVFVVLLAACFATLGVCLAVGVLPPWSGLALLALVPSVALAANVLRHAEAVPRLIPFLGLNVLTTLLTPLLLAVGLLVSGSA